MAIQPFEVSNEGHKSKSAMQKSLHRPVPSPDGCLLALIVPEIGIHILSLLDGHPGDRTVKTISFPNEHRAFLQNVDILHWSAETIHGDENGIHAKSSSKMEFGQRWLVLAGDRRMMALRIDLTNRALSSQISNDFKLSIICDVEFPDHYGRVSAAEFVSSHRDVLLLFEMNLHGSLLSLTKAERQDLKSVKFHTTQALAADPAGKYLAVLRRENSQDQIAVFDLGEAERAPYTFACNMTDVQGIKWSPDGKPVLMVWESPAFGARVRFFTAMGHPLTLLDLTWGASVANPALADLTGSGVTAIAWSKQGGSSTHTVLVVGDGSKQVVYRCQKTQSLSVEAEVIVSHPDVVKSTDCIIWQEQHDGQFHQEAGLIETATAEPDVELVAINADGGMFATKVSCLPRTIWIWQAGQQKPSFVISLRDEIKQLLWHPALAGVLIVITRSKSPTIRVWYDKESPPVAGDIHFADAIPTSSWKATWIRQNHGEQRPDQLFMISSIKQFQVGHLGVSKGQLSFESVLDQPYLDNDEPSMMLDTPSKPGKYEKQTMIEGKLFARTDTDPYWFSDAR